MEREGKFLSWLQLLGGSLTWDDIYAGPLSGRERTRLGSAWALVHTTLNTPPRFGAAAALFFRLGISDLLLFTVLPHFFLFIHCWYLGFLVGFFCYFSFFWGGAFTFLPFLAFSYCLVGRLLLFCECCFRVCTLYIGRRYTRGLDFSRENVDGTKLNRKGLGELYTLADWRLEWVEWNICYIA